MVIVKKQLQKKLYDVLNDLELMDEFQDLKEWYEETTKEEI